jgi:hypothetical protein
MSAAELAAMRAELEAYKVMHMQNAFSDLQQTPTDMQPELELRRGGDGQLQLWAAAWLCVRM